MTQPLSISERPPFHPYKCIRCKGGPSSPGREFFVNLGVSLDEEFNPQFEGNIYYCNICIKALLVEANEAIMQWNLIHAPWDSPDRVASTYTWAESADNGIERAPAGIDSGSPEVDDRDAESELDSIELDDSASEGADEFPESAILAAFTNDEPRSSLDVTRGITLDFNRP